MYSKPDHYTDKAKKEGYAARSVYKLQEIDEKNRLIRPGMRILDIGASPGSWSLYCLRRLKGKGEILAVDLNPFSQKELGGSPLFSFVQGDIMEADTKARLAGKAPFDLVLSDAAPATTGSRLVDCGRSYKLAETVLAIAGDALAAGGSTVIKVFQGGDEQQLLNMMRGMFDAAKIAKPKASRNESFEIFLVGLNKRRAG